MPGRVNGWYGWKPDVPDFKDYPFRLAPHVTIAESTSLVDSFPACYDQGDLGSCVFNSIVGIGEFLRKLQKQSPLRLSRLFLYYNTRVDEGTVSEDAGAEIRDAVKSLQKLGAPSEKEWPYVPEKFARKPTATAYKHAMAHQALRYERLDNRKLDDLLGCLSGGFPFVFGFSVYDYFESDEMEKTGILKLPQTGEKNQGGHAVVAVGHDNIRKAILVRNSWGTKWGTLAGHFWMPFDYITNPNLADDFWAIRQVE